MIQPSELRIGNIIKEGIVVGLISSEVITIDGKHFEPEDISPITLTGRLLEKAGFKRYKDTECFEKAYSNQGELLIFSGSSLVGQANGVAADEFYYSFHRTYHILKYLHQLQNLYFALTGTELALKALQEEGK